MGLADAPGLLPRLILAAAATTGSGGQVALLAIIGTAAAVLGAIGGILTASATRSRGATEGFRDLTNELQEDRSDLRAENQRLRIEVDRLRFLCYDNEIDWRPPNEAAGQVEPSTGAAP